MRDVERVCTVGCLMMDHGELSEQHLTMIGLKLLRMRMSSKHVRRKWMDTEIEMIMIG